MSLILTQDISELEAVVMHSFKRKKTIFNKIKRYKYQSCYNCYCFVAFFFGFTDRLHWFDEDEMNDLLNCETVKIKVSDIQKGDIAVYRRRNDNELIHTAILLDSNHIIHKPGGFPLETSNRNKNMYVGKNTKIEYRRIK